ncbi:uncharacterized protein FA14DRAFT_161694 [Meira miltonrushii]|uniref:Matrin-type domain-containing protein n=1 Tax=Meira miltonrushii TaxID=1280837 RepID=A0A316VDA7_9BASI|nr:uncharacterized protein FA14DRAFT_161694 [Meira miltonrushii]PWN34233.1 hypothetical protein FA14DRAFT_161694 [Meira miltonrushii]
MADTSIFEVTRQTHEEVERYTQAAVDVLVSSSTSDITKDSIRKQHQISSLLDRIVSRNATLYNLYGDASGDMQQERLVLSNASAGPSNTNGASETDDMEEFYNRLNRIRDYHKKYPNAMPDAFTIDTENAEGAQDTDMESGIDNIDRMFSGEEMGGRFIDLYIQHDEFLNLKGVRRITYLQYLDSFDRLRGSSGRIPVEIKRSEAYRTYLQSLQTYLLNFLRKSRPLSDVDALELSILAGFEQDWSEGRVEDWENQGEDRTPAETQARSTDGIWCEACQRSFAKQTVFDAHLKGQKHIKATERMASGGNAKDKQGPSNEAQELEKRKRISKAKAIARDETMVIALGQELHSVRIETRANVERKAALTERERQAEAEALAAQPSTQGAGEDTQAEDDEDENEKIYNPLKLPLGWDGRPIPFWLYKLHGLGVEFKCEICSDYVYQGRKNFERHFSESRHAFGMRALGLPNTKHFYEITRIQDALALADKLKKQGKIVADEQGDAEEVEDEHGNTYSRKTYELLKRQGLI